jgi:hypothetical protein
MNPEWHIRPYEPLSVAKEVVRPYPRAERIDCGDTVILRLKNDESGENVCSRDPAHFRWQDSGSHLSCEPHERTWRQKTCEGTPVEFEETHVFRLEKATQSNMSPTR